MKKIILSGLLALLTTGAMAQSVNSEISVLTPTGENVKSVLWLGQAYNLTQKDIDTKDKFETTLSFYKDKNLINEFKHTEIGDFPVKLGISKTKSVLQVQEIKVGTDIKYAILPFDDYDEGVLIRSSVFVVSENKEATSEDQKYSVIEHTKTSLVPLDREVILNQWGNEELRVLVKKAK